MREQLDAALTPRFPADHNGTDHPLSDAVQAQQATFWRTYLADAPRLLDIATDRPRPMTHIFHGAAHTVTIATPIVEALVALCQQEGADLFVGLLAVWQTLLHRYTSQTDIVVGTLSGHQSSARDGLVTQHSTILALRGDLGGDPAFRQLVQRVRTSRQQAFDHQALPFAHVVELLGEAQTSYPPIFQTAIVVHDASEHPLSQEARLSELDKTAIQYDLALDCAWQAAGLEVTFAYNANLFDAATISRMADHFTRLLAGIVADPAQPLSAFSLLSAAEYEQLVREWNVTQTEYPRDATIHAIFAACAKATPDAVAVVCEDAHLTYGALDARANQLAHLLRSLGVGPDVPVGLCVPRSLDMIISLVAILKAGGFYVPIDPAYPAERIDFMLADAQVGVLLTHHDVTLPPLDSTVRVLALDHLSALLDGQPTVDPQVEMRSQHLAYVNYTSGSTGAPKGVCIPHQGVLRLVKGTNFIRLTASDIFLQLATISFDAATLELWGPLLNGGKLVVFPPYAPSLDDLGQVVVRQQITTLWLTAGLFHVMVEEQLASLRGVRQLVAGGDVISPSHVRRILQAHPGLTLIDGYGPTENSTFTCCSSLTDPSQVGNTVSIGRAIANTQVYVLDAQRQPVPVGVPGELYAGGDGVARGYLRRASLTAERFIPDPFSAIPGARLYRSGDRVRYLADGTMEFLGRIDQQVKVRGYRIELGEVESVLTQHPQVRDCVVIVREDVPGDKRLVAYVVTESSLAVNDLQVYLSDRLPAYMVPAAMVAMATLPLNASNKVDRRALPMPDQTATTYEAPRTPLEAQIAAIWAAVLHLERIGITDNFFSLGGHSLLATRALARVRAVFAINLPLSAFFDAPTVATFAMQVERAQDGIAPGGPPPIIATQANVPQPLSYAQERMWFLDQLQPDSALYVVALAVRLHRVALSLPLLRQSVAAMVARHASLRTTFVVTPDGPLQVITPDSQVPFTIVDLRHLPPPEREAAIQHYTESEARTPFHLANGPLFRVVALLVDTDEAILLLAQHHIISDGWSLAVLLQDLLATYDALHADQTPRLPELPVQYTDYASWQREWLRAGALTEQLRYWENQLSGVPTLLELSTDHPRPTVASYRGARHAFSIDLALSQQLQVLSQREGATLYMTLLAAFEVFLQRYTRQNDFIVGTVVAGRQRPELEHLIGFFVNTLPLHADLTGDLTFQMLLERTRTLTLEAFSHQDVPFERIVEALHPARDLSYHPLIQAMFVLQNTGLGSLETLDGSLRVVETETGTSQFDLTLEVTETDQGLHAVFQYNTDIFEAVTVRRMAAQFSRLLAGIVADPQQSIARLPLLSAAEQHQLVVERNATQVDYSQIPLALEAIEAQVARDPLAPALVDGDATMTYGELNRRANQLAHHLIQSGVGPEVVVGVCFERSIDLIVALLGIWKAGGAYLPIDPEYPIERRAFMMQDAHIPVLLTRPTLVAHLPVSGVRVVFPDAPEVRSQPESNPQRAIVAEQLAYVIYTSGSTGQPKGVQITHSNLHNMNCFYRQRFAVTHHDRFSQMAGPGFDVTIIEIWPCLASGACLHIVDDETRINPEGLRDWLIAHEITVTVVPTVLVENLFTITWPASTAMRVMNTGGEALRSFPPIDFPVALINDYGPTEATVFVTSGQVHPTTNPEGAPSIGRAIVNTQLYLLDDQLQPVPDGVPGELYIGGAQVARGYLGRPDLTEERFPRDPFSDRAGARFYKTGDLCRYRPNGDIEYLGRTDLQVKIRGFRIELGEIEVALRDHPTISQALVVVREDIPGDKRIVAYVIPQPDQDMQVAALREYLQTRLPAYMVPTAIVAVVAYPLTPNNKVDRRALPIPMQEALGDSDVAAPRTPLEAQVAAIWAEVLHVDQVSITANFFALGGHSLLATRLISRLRSALGVDLPLRALFTAPTVAELSLVLASATAMTTAALSPIPRVPRDQPLPLASGQERLWFFDQLDPQSTLYLVPSAVRVQRPVNMSLLEKSLQIVVQRHESLRTTFVPMPTGPVQVIAPSVDVPLHVIDLRGMAPKEQATAIDSYAQQEAQTPFRLDAVPLLRAKALWLDDAEMLLLVTQHHIITDGWSVEVLVREWLGAYDSLRQGLPLSLPAMPIQYADYAVWQHTWAQSEACDAQRTFWQEQLADIPMILDLPTDHTRPALQTYRGAHHAFTVPREVVVGLQQVSQQAGATLYTTLLAAFEVLLHRYTRQDDFIVGTVTAGRTRPELEDLLGFFVNTLPIPAKLGADPRFSEVVARTQQIVLAAQEQQDIPFDQLVEALHPVRDASHPPLVQVLFTFLDEWHHFEGVQIEPITWQMQSAKFDLTLDLTQTATGLWATIEYNTDLFESPTISRMAEHFLRLLGGIVADPTQPISTFPLLSTEEVRQQTETWQSPMIAVPDVSLSALFEQQAARTPTAIALIASDGRLTYAELNDRANQLAYHLRSLGAGPEQIVAVCLDRTQDLIIAILGILKSGAAYLPLDAAYPAERLLYYVQDAGATLLVTSRVLRDVLPTTTARVVEIDAIATQLAAYPTANLTTPPLPRNLAYVIYTSGSTGQPKGVAIEHCSAVTMVTWAHTIYAPDDLGGVFAGTSICFDLSVFEIFVPLSIGGTVLLAENALSLPTLAARDQVTLLNVVPSAMSELLLLGAIPPSARILNMAGEALAGSLVQRLYTQTNAQEIYNLYGPTEDTTYSTYTLVPRDATSSPSIGRPIAQSQAYVLDAHQQLVPVGVVGELYLGGAGLARGYLHRPDLTAERFVQNPFSADRTARLYKTGDLARYRPNGEIDYQGRIDHQVKVRGYRIELGEIESVLNRHPQVHESIVVVREDVAGDQRIVAYVTTTDALPANALREHIQARLPGYMVPTSIVELATFPLTPNGKIDRRALPIPDQAALEASDYVAPRTPLEAQVAAIWMDVLHLDRVSVTADFFALGGHSLLATRFISRLREDLHLAIPLRVIFEQPTVAAMAQYIAQLNAQTAIAATGPIQKAARGTGDLADLVDRLEQLSDEDIAALLADETSID